MVLCGFTWSVFYAADSIRFLFKYQRNGFSYLLFCILQYPFWSSALSQEQVLIFFQAMVQCFTLTNLIHQLLACNYKMLKAQ